MAKYGLVLSLALAGLVGCAGPEVVAPEATAVGEPLPGAVTASATIGAQGGTLTSSDGKVTLTIPEGALAADTVISAVAISNLAHGGIGRAAYRMTGTETFLKPVSLTFSWTEEELNGAAPEFLEVAFQNKEGFWQLTDASVVDVAAKTITTTTTHFTDFIPVAPFRIVPEKVTLEVNGAQRFQLEHSYNRPIDAEHSLGFGWAKPGVVLASKIVGPWAVDGVVGGNSTIGTIYADVDRGGYAAPEKKPSPDTVTVSLRVTDWRGDQKTAWYTAKVRIVEKLPKQLIDVRGTYARQGQTLTAFVTGNVTDTGFKLQMGFPVTDETPPVTDIVGGEVTMVADTRPPCLVPMLNGPWDELRAQTASITGSFLTISGDRYSPSISMGDGEGDCAVTRRLEPPATGPNGVQVQLPLEFFTSTTAPEQPVTVTQDYWTVTFTTVKP